MVQEEEQLRKETDFYYKDQRLVIVRAAYCDNNNTALLLETVAGGSFGCATVNVIDLPPDLVAVKDYSENAGMLQALVEPKIVSPPKSYIRSGYVTLPVCQIIEPDLL